MLGQTIDGKYQIVRLLGQGGMGAVYEAAHLGTGRRVAVKVILPGVAISRDAIVRFQREARAAGVIESQHIVQVLDTGIDREQGVPFMVMEYLIGEDLQKLGERIGALAPELALRIGAQACGGLHKAHEARVIHRDIKPANLFLNQDPKSSEVTVKVCDFGVAKKLQGFGFVSSGGGHQSLTRSGGVVGSPMYMSPEQARNAKAVTERTDVWSLSVVLWEALSGLRLWQGQNSLGELIIALVTEPIARLETAAPWVPRELARAVHRGLERDPEKRTPTMKALIEEIESFSGNSDRLVTSQLQGLSEQQRGEMALKVSLSDSAARRIADLGKNLAQKPPPKEEIGATSTIGGSTHERGVDRGGGGAGRGAMLGVALLSAAVAGGSAYFFGRNHSAPAPNVAPAAAPAPTSVQTRVQVSPADALVLTSDGAVPVVNGEATLHGAPGQTVSVTVQRGTASRTFSVSIGSDGIASPSRLALP